MLPSLTANDYVRLGQTMGVLKNPRNARTDNYKRAIAELLDWLDKCGFAISKAAAAVLANATIADKEGIITDATARELSMVVSTIQHGLEHESKTREVIVLNTGGVSPKLRGLPAKVTLTAAQQHLLDETVRCIQCAAYCGAAVMGWNLTYDYIRHWMWSDPARLAAFNAKLTAYTDRHGRVVYPVGITVYGDFYTIKPVLGERDVLDFMKDGGLLSGVYEKLAAYLKDRNSFAHANDLVPSMYQTNYYIEQLIDIITSPPFI